MANFMGPMAPPQAAPNAPPQLDIRTNPSQRAQFKEFMQGMNRPVMPPTTAPIAPMLPAPMPSPMDQIDIFAPAPMADGGVVGGLQDLGQMSDQMVEALNTVVYGGEPGGGFGGGVSSGAGFGGGNMPPPLPSFDMSFFDPERPGYLEQRYPSGSPFARPIGSNAVQGVEFRPGIPAGEMQIQTPEDAYAQAQANARRQRAGGFMGRVVLPGEMSFDAFKSQYEFKTNNPMQPLQTLANGGGVGSYFEDIPTASDPAMAGGTTNLIDASGSNPISSMDDVEMGMANPPLPVTGTGALVSSLDAFLDRKLDRDFADMDRMAAMGNAVRASTPMAKMRDFASGILGATQMDGPMGSTIGIRPVARDGNLGIMANFSLPFEDGGPVGMFLGGDPQAYGDERGRQDTSETAQERQRVGGTTNVFEGDSAPGGNGDDGDSVNEAIAAAQQVEDLGQFFEDVAASQKPVDLTFGAPRTDTSGRIVTGAGQFSDDQQKDDFQRIDDVISAVSSVRDPFDRPSSLLGSPLIGDTSSAQLFDTLDPVTQARVMNPPADSIVEPFVGDEIASDSSARPSGPPPADMPGANPITDLLAGEPGTSGGGDDSLSMAIGRMFETPVTFKTASGNVTGTALDDLNRRMGEDKSRVNKAGDGQFMGLGKLAVDALLGIGRDKATDIFTNIEAGRPGVIDARTGQITGYIGDNALGFGKSYTGRSGFDPFSPGADATFDPSRNAFIVNRQQPNQDEGERASGQTPAAPPPATDPADTTPPPLMITPPTTGLPPSGPSPTDVLVPSTRTNVPVTVPSILPTQGTAPTFLPQSFLDLLASFNRPAPRAMQDGGAVLDKAADDFLEALKVA